MSCEVSPQRLCYSRLCSYSLLVDKECCSKFFDTSFHFRVIHYLVRLADDAILFSKSKENIQDLRYFRREIDSKKFSSTEMPF